MVFPLPGRPPVTKTILPCPDVSSSLALVSCRLQLSRSAVPPSGLRRIAPVANPANLGQALGDGALISDGRWLVEVTNDTLR